MRLMVVMAVSDKAYVYALIDPETQQPRYVGQTRKDLAKRLRSHLGGRRFGRTPKDAWLIELANGGLRPSIVMLEQCTNDDADEAERRHIVALRAKGANLLNAAAPCYMHSNDEWPFALYVRMPASLHDALIEMSDDEGRSLNAQIVWILRRAVGDWKRRRVRKRDDDEP